MVLTIAVNNTGGAPRRFSLVVSTSDGSAISGVDYSPVTETIQFDVGDTSKTHSITIIPDNICEEDEFFISVIDSASGVEPINITSPQATIAIDDTEEIECGKFLLGMNR